MKTKFLRLLACALFASAFVARAAIPPAEDLLPSDTLFVITVPDFAALKTAAHQSPQWQFWNDPAMKPFHDKFVAKWKDSFVAPVERDLGVKLADFESLPQGQLTFAVTKNGWNGIAADKSPGFILLLDAKNKSDLLKTNLAALEKKWRDDGKPVHTQTVRGIPFSIVPLASNDIPPSLSALIPHRQPVQELGKTPEPEKTHQLVVGQYQSLLIAGNSIDAIAPVVAKLTGSAMPSLSDNAIFAADKLAQFRNAPLYYGWFNARVFFHVLEGIPPEAPNPEAPSPLPRFQWSQMLAVSGLSGVRSVSFTVRQNREGADTEFYIAAPESARQGLLKIFATQPKTAVPPVFVPADVAKFWRWRVDGQQGWAELQKMVGNISPGALAGLNAAIDMANANAQQTNPGFDIRKYLIENLGDDFMGYQKIPSGDAAANPNNQSSIFLFAVNDTDKAVAAIRTLMSLSPTGEKAPEPRDFLGHKIYSIPLPGPRMAGASPAPGRALYCTAGGGYVALSSDVSMIEDYLRAAGNPPKPLAGVPGLIDAAQRVGGAGNGLFGYENQRETLRALFAILKNQASGGANGTSVAMLPKELQDWMDFSLLPDYDKVSKYFYFSVYGSRTTSEGISFKTFAPRPPDLK